MNGKVCLIVIFNHHFIDAVQVLDKIYKNKFFAVKYLIPFYTGDRKDIIAVYESSYQFHGYLIQAIDKIFEAQYDWYLFVADDMLLNPKLNENNIVQELHLSGMDFYISSLAPINRRGGYSWGHSRFYMRPFLSEAVNYQGFIPTYEAALKRMRKFFPDYEEYFFDGYFEGATVAEREEFLKRNKGNKLIYPLLNAYSDFFICHKSMLHKFSKLCGVFSAINLFVEMAIPTAMALLSDKIMLESGIQYKGRSYWDGEREKFEARYDFNINTLLNDYPEEVLFYHPVKMSKWNFKM